VTPGPDFSQTRYRFATAFRFSSRSLGESLKYGLIATPEISFVARSNLPPIA
jgi:hypothetical protein